MRYLLFIVPILTGCTHHYDIASAHEVAGDEVVIEGPHGEVTAVGVATPGGMMFHDTANGSAVPATEIVRIKETRHGRGALEGLGIGAGIGAAFGIIIGTGGNDDYYNDGAASMVLGVLGAGLGGGLGLVVGLFKGSTSIYERSGVSVRVGGPAGSTAGVTVSF